MSNVVIQFRARKGPRGDRRTAEEPEELLSHAEAKQSRLEQQLARVTALIEELEDITRSESELPPRLLWQARVGIDKTRNILRPFPGYVGNIEREADPQPDVDRAVLERLYGCFDAPKER